MAHHEEVADLMAENERLRGLLKYATDTDAYRRLRAENERLCAELATLTKLTKGD